MSKYVTIVRNPGLPINEDYLSRIVKQNRAYTGVAAALNGKLVVASKPKPPSVEGLQAILEQLKDSTLVFSIGDVKGLPDEDMMPYTILKDGDNNPLVVLCLDGAFDRHRVANTAHSGEYHVGHGLIERKIKKWFDNGGIDNVKKELDDVDNAGDFCNMWSNKGCATFLFADGTAKTIHNYDDSSRNMSWGFASDPYGFKEEQQKTVKEEPKAKEDTLLGALMNKVSGKVSAPAPGPGAVVSAATLPPKTETTATGLPSGCIIEKPDLSVYDTKKKRKDYYEARIGNAPHGFNSSPPPLIKHPDGSYTLADTKSLQSIGTMVTASDTATPGDSPREIGGTQSQTVDKPKDITPHHVSTTNPVIKSSSQIAMISPDKIDKMKSILKREEFLGFASDDMTKILDPKEMKATVEKTLPTLFERMGWGSLNMMDGWTLDQFRLFTKVLFQAGEPQETVAKQFFDMRNHDLRNRLTNPNAKFGTGEKKIAM